MAERSLTDRLWYEFFKSICKWGSIGFFGTRYYGLRNIPPQGPVLIVANHQSHLDPPIIGAAFPRQGNFVARKTLYDLPVMGPLIRTLKTIPIDRDGMGVGGLKEALRVLKRGELLLIFPEGTRSLDGEIQPFRPGFTALATRTGATIVPAAIEGAQRAWPKGTSLPRPRKVHVMFGRPLPPDEVRRYSDRELVSELERRVRTCQAELRQHGDFQGKGSRRSNTDTAYGKGTVPPYSLADL